MGQACGHACGQAWCSPTLVVPAERWTQLDHSVAGHAPCADVTHLTLDEVTQELLKLHANRQWLSWSDVRRVRRLLDEVGQRWVERAPLEL